MKKQLTTLRITGILTAALAVQASSQESPYKLTRGFPADEATIEKARHATTLRRAIETYK